MIDPAFVRKPLAQMVLTLLGLSGVVLVFLPFLHHLAPGAVFLRSLPPSLPPSGISDILFWPLAAFVVLPFAISTGYVRWLRTGRLSRQEAGVGYALALLFASALFLLSLMEWGNNPPGTAWQEVLHLFLLFVAAYGAAAWFAIQNLGNTAPPVPNPLVAMQMIYLFCALFWLPLGLSGSFGKPGIGLYLTIVAGLAYSAQIVIAAARPWQALLFFVPFGLLWAEALWGW